MSDVSTRKLGIPQIGVSVPGWIVRAAFAVVGIGLTVVCYQPPFWIVGAGLTGWGVVAPRRLVAWLLLPFLAASQLARHPAPFDWQFMMLLAGVHLLHVLAAQIRQLPWRITVQLAALAHPLVRFVAIQVPVQLVAIAVLDVFAPDSNGDARLLLPVFGIAGAAALLLTALLLVPLMRDRR